MSDYEIQRVEKLIVECLSGAGGFDDLQRLKAEKAELEDRAYFDSIQSLKVEIEALQAQRVADYDALNELQSELQKVALVIDEKAEILLQARQSYAIVESELTFKRMAVESTKEILNEKQAELSELIRIKTGQI